jgi:O-antigen ligase
MPRRSKRREPEPERVASRPDPGVGIAGGARALAFAAAAFLVDPRAEASFEAPKRLAALVGVAVAAVAALAFAPADAKRRPGPPRRSAAGIARILAAAAVAGAALSAVVSPRRAMSLDALRGLAIFALLLPLGASRVAARLARPLLAVFVALLSADAVVSVLQSWRIYQPFPLETAGGRMATGAFVGNVGYLALALALAAVAALGIAASASRPVVRIACAGAAIVAVADLVVNQNFTSLTALAAGAAALSAARLGRRALLPLAAVAAAVLLAFALFRPARVRFHETVAAARAGDWDRLLTYRLGPWAAAVEMARERPLLGFGPGTFAAEFVPHRLAAEVRLRRRFVNPLVTSSYGEAHSEPLQALAEGGLAGLAAIGAFCALLAALWRPARSDGPAGVEAAILLAILAAGGIAALTWFPFQRPISSLPLLLAAGRGWRLAAERAAGTAAA